MIRPFLHPCLATNDCAEPVQLVQDPSERELFKESWGGSILRRSGRLEVPLARDA